MSCKQPRRERPAWKRLTLKQRGAAERARKVIIGAEKRWTHRMESLASANSKLGRPSLAALSPPRRAFRVEHALHGNKLFFETIGEKRAEDALRVRGLRSALQRTASEQALANDLGEQLAWGVAQLDPPATLACSEYMRYLRICITGAVWQMHAELAHRPRSVFTLIPRGYSLTPDELERFNLPRAKQGLRSALNRAGATAANGALIVFLHGEWDETAGRYQLHWHGWAAGGMIGAVRRLRKQRAYQSTQAARVGDTDGVRNRVVVSKKPILNPAYRLSYMVQSFWPSRATGVLPEHPTSKGGRYRVRGKRRIPEPQHSQSLLWLHQWRIEDISLLMGMSVARGRLRLSNTYTTYNNREG